MAEASSPLCEVKAHLESIAIYKLSSRKFDTHDDLLWQYQSKRGFDSNQAYKFEVFANENLTCSRGGVSYLGGSKVARSRLGPPLLSPSERRALSLSHNPTPGL